jgi:hypothetical protein
MWRNISRRCVFVLTALASLTFAPRAGATTWRVANNGVDSTSCGTSANPCRSITQAIANASGGDKIVVGPGTYGDLNSDGILGDSPGEENPGVVGCMVCINKSVTLVSSDGAAETVIDARDVPNLSENVAITANNVKFGAAGQGFTVTNVLTLADQESPTFGIATSADQVSILGNRVVVERSQGTITFSGISAGNFPVNDNTVLIEGNHVMGWEQGIGAAGVNITVKQNSVQFNDVGIAVGPGTAKGNVVTDNLVGIQTYDTSALVKGNAVLGNGTGILAPANSTIQDNNIFGNGCGLDVAGSFPAPTLVTATNNYWGAATGPGPAPANGVCGAEANVAVVVPFATQPFTLTITVTP